MTPQRTGLAHQLVSHPRWPDPAWVPDLNDDATGERLMDMAMEAGSSGWYYGDKVGCDDVKPGTMAAVTLLEAWGAFRR